MYLNLIKTIFYIFFIQTNKNYQTKQNIKSLLYLLGSETANHVNFMQPMLVSYSTCYSNSLEGDNRKESKILTSGNHEATLTNTKHKQEGQIIVIPWAVRLYLGIIFEL